MESWEREWADYYAELRCSPDDPIEVIRGIYRAIVKRYHPDRPQGDREKMVRINAAFEVLSDAVRRRAYDRAYAARRATTDEPAPAPGTTRGRGRGPAAPEDANSGPDSEPADPEDASPQPDSERPEPAASSTSSEPSGAAPSGRRASGSAAFAAAGDPSSRESSRGQSTSGSARELTPRRLPGEYQVQVDPDVLDCPELRLSGLWLPSPVDRLLAAFPRERLSTTVLEATIFQVTAMDQTPMDFLRRLYDQGYRSLNAIELLNLEVQHWRHLQRYTWILGLESPWRVEHPRVRAPVDDDSAWIQYLGTELFASIWHRDDSGKVVMVKTLWEVKAFGDRFFDDDTHHLFVAATRI